MTNRTQVLWLVLLVLALSGCSLFQGPAATPTPTATPHRMEATATATSTEMAPTEVAPTAVPTEHVAPTLTRQPQPSETPTPLPSLTPTPEIGSGLLQQSAEAPAPLPEEVPLLRQPVGPGDTGSADALAHSEVPVRDLRSLAIRLRGVRPDVPAAISDTSPDYAVGTVRTFKVHDDDSQETYLIEAELRYKTDHLYMWVEKGVEIALSRLQEAADTFENQIYPANRAFFGSEWTPGVDGDPHLSILHARRIGAGVAGYYWSADEYPAEVRPDSNQMEMFYINADNANVGSAFYLGTLAHEFQHMIHWYNDRNEETWLNEGMSELASLINGFDPGGSDYAWSLEPDTQLNTWSDDGSRSAHYGGAFLFAAYLLDRFGESLTQAVVAHPANGIRSIDAVLDDDDSGLTFGDVFADWVVANYLDDPALGDGRYGYELIDIAQPQLDEEHQRYPVERFTQVVPYGVDYVYLEGGAELTLDFYGDTRAPLLNTQPHSGDFFWYANRGDDSDMRLTREFDLSTLSQATLRFWTWYDIEADWDYGYVMASKDSGATWQILRGPSTTDANPNGNSFGWAYTGASGDGPQWIEEEIPLDAYVGHEVMIRFEYITDDALNAPGWVLDDITVPELEYADDVERDEGGWNAEGFVRTDNAVPQGYVVQLITFGPETTVQRLPLRPDQSGRWLLPLAQADHGVLLVSALARVTTEPAGYYYRITEER
jgi:immune inhibitor A